MSSALALSPSQETKWTVVSGAMKGTVRLMSISAFTIGRSPENEFVIVNDPKCSRKHAAVQWTAAGCQIATMNHENRVLVNGREIDNAILNDGDVVTLGETEVQFNLTTAPAAGTHEANTKITLVAPTGMGLTQAMPYGMAAPAPRRRKRKKASSNNPVRMAIYVLIALAVLFLLTPTGKKKKGLSLRTEQQIKEDIETANKLNEAAQAMPIKRMDETVTGRQAQAAFVTGFRDYRKGQFERSIDSFQACLALNPGHSLCNRYLRLAQRRFNEVVQYNMVLGRRYRDQNQFKACRSAFRNVIVMVKDANSTIYKEAKANYDACNAQAEGTY